MGDAEVPDGIVPILITGPTQTIIGVVIDEDVTEESPWKLIPKATIVADMKARAAVSDFSPLKKELNLYDGDEILVVLDAEFLYGQNFYLAITEAAKEKYFWPNGRPVDGPAVPVEGGVPGAAGEEEEEIFEYRPPVHRPWISLGSEKEIDDSLVQNKRRYIKLELQRKRKYFNQEFSFADCDGETIDMEQDMEHAEPTHKRLLDCSIQSVSETLSEGTQTIRAWPRNQWTQTKPREHNEEDIQKIIKSTNMMEKITTNLLPWVRVALQQNDLCNVFEDCWAALGTDEDGFGNKSGGHLKEYQSFTDLKYSKNRRLTCIDWHPTIKGVIGVSCAQRCSLYERIQNAPKLLLSPSLVLIWNFTDPIHPCLLLQAPSDVYSFQFCPTNPNLVAAGCINGQIALWDISKYYEKLITVKGNQKKKQSLFGEDCGPETPVVLWNAVTAIDHGHKAPIYQIQWIPRHCEIDKMGNSSKNDLLDCVQLMTAAADGTFAVWDTRPPPEKKSKARLGKRGGLGGGTADAKKEPEIEPIDISEPFKYLNLQWRPTIKANVSRSESAGTHNPLIISLRPVIPGELLKTEFYCGTEEGDILYCRCKLEKDNESGKMVAPKPLWAAPAHAGPVQSLSRSPFYDDIILSVGGWSFAIWKEEPMSSDDYPAISQTPLLHSRASEKRYTAGTWSPTRPAIFFVGTEEGNLEVWDLLEKTHEPSVVQNVTASTITEVRAWVVSSKLHLIAISDSVGTLHILELPFDITHPTPNEQQTMGGYLSRETQRIKYFRDRTDNPPQDIGKQVGTMDVEALDAISDEELENDFKDYLKLETTLIQQLGLTA